MEETQQQPPSWPSFPPAGEAKFNNASPGTAGGSSFTQDSGYSSYHSTTPNNTFNLSSRHGVSSTLATIDEVNERDCSLNDSGSSAMGVPSSNILTPKTAASIDQISNFHLSSPDSSGRLRRPSRRRCNFDHTANVDGSPKSSFLAPTTPERLPRSASFDSTTPQSTVNLSGQQSQLTPHKAKSGLTGKRKRSNFSEKLRSEGHDVPDENAVTDENRGGDLNDSLDCKRLDISPIMYEKRPKLSENITNLIRCSTPKTASSQPQFLAESTVNLNVENVIPGGAQVLPPAGKGLFRRFHSSSPGKMQQQGIKQRLSMQWRKENRGGGRPENARELTPKKNNAGSRIVGYAKPSNEQRVLAEILNPGPPKNFAELINGTIVEDRTPRELPVDFEMFPAEQALTTIPTMEDFSMTPSKANLTDPELPIPCALGGLSVLPETSVFQAGAEFRFTQTLDTIFEHDSPILLETERLPCRSKTLRTTPKLRNRNAAKLANRESLKSSPVPKNQLNVLKRLYERNTDTLHILLDYLTDEDLVQVVQVSNGWKELIREFPKQWLRLQKHLELQEDDKENRYQRRSNLPALSKGDKAEPSTTGQPVASTSVRESAITANAIPPAVDGGLPAAKANSSVEVKRVPFKICNMQNNSNVGNCSTVSNVSFYASIGSEYGNVTMPEHSRRSNAATVHSPPVSPSKINFVTNQKAVSGLKKSERLRPCPRCHRPSRIILSCSSKKDRNKARASASTAGARLEKSHTLPDPDLSNDRNEATIAGGPSRNNNDYTTTNSRLQQRSTTSKGYPDSVRKNLFNTSSSSGDETKPPVAARADSRRNSAPHLSDTARKGMRMKLGTKSASVSGADSQLADVRESKSDYAICTNQNCGFKFCTKCECNFHPDTVCPDLSPNSPSKDEERAQSNVACSRKSRKELMRLCRNR